MLINNFKIIQILSLIVIMALATQADLFSQPRGVVTNADMDVEFVPRMAHSEAVYAITTQEGSVDLLITDSSILIQFSDDGLANIAKEIEKETSPASEKSHLAAVIRNMVKSGVSTLLDRAMAIPLYEISDVYYSDGTLVIKNRHGDEIFNDIDIGNKKVMQDFSRRDARRFVGHAERLLD